MVEAMVRLEMVTADPSMLLRQIMQQQVVMLDVVQKDGLVLQFSVSGRDVGKLRRLAESRGEKLTVISRKGLFWQIEKIKERPVLLAGMVMLLLLVCLLPTRVLFIRVEGNENIPKEQILAAAEECGVVFGASRRALRSETMKNMLLQKLPQLQWAGINTRGVVAVITVRERSEAYEQPETGGVSHVVAAQDGVVTEFTALRGNPVCSVGQAVRTGDILISGYLDCGLFIQATGAQGEVFANTSREFTAVLPAEICRRGEILVSEKKYSLLIGKKRINFFKDSGISDSSCVKMYSEYYITLPGGFQLPVAILVEEWIYHETSSLEAGEDAAYPVLQSFAERCLAESMVAGRILQKQEQLQYSEGVYLLSGQYACHEMIGRVKQEEIGYSDGKSN